MMWEPFSEPARRVFVRAQQVAQMFGSSTIGTEHMTFALAEADDEVGSALANAVDREAMRQLLGAVSASPTEEMTFTRGAKQSIELAFESAHRLKQKFIGPAHLALGIVASSDPPPLVATTDSAVLRAALELAAKHEQPLVEGAGPKGASGSTLWRRVTGDADPFREATRVLDALSNAEGLDTPGTSISLTIAVPGAEERTWSWVREEEPT
jgi:ATP-dependent Clp protease ATP-binding subunit ClpA